MNRLKRRLPPVIFVLLTAILMPSAYAIQALNAVPRNVQFSNLSTEDGLSSEFVHDIVQDRNGYMWFATQTGLNRFDGHDIRVYEHRSEDPDSLSHSFVWSLQVDSEGVLWIGTDRGLNTYDPSTDSFDRQPFGGSVSPVRVRKITQDTNGKFWIGSVASGLISVEPENGVVVSYRHDPSQPDSLPNDHVIAIYEDQKGELWVGTDGGGLARFDHATGSFVIYRRQPGNASSLGNDEIRSIYEDREGRLWIGTAQGGLNQFHRATGQFTRHEHDANDPRSLGNGQVPSMYQDANGTFWVGTEDGLSEWRPSIDGFVNYRRDPADRKSLINNRVNAIIQDASGVLWLATNGGVSSWNYVSDTFHHYGSAEDLLQSDVVTSIAEDSAGALWVATYGGGLSRLDLDTGAVRHYRHNPNDPTSLSDDRVMTVHVDGEDTVWAGTRNGGLCRLDDDGGFTQFRFDPNDERTLSGNAVTRIFSEQSGALWVGVFGGGLNRLRWQGGAPIFDRFRHDPQDPTSLSGDRVLAIHQDSAGVIWVGTENAGLNRFIAGSNRFQRFDVENFHASDGSNPVSGTPWEIHESRDGAMWIGTLGQGLLRWSAADRAARVTRFEQFGLAEGLASEVYGIVEGPDGELWLSSSRGLFRFDPERGSVRKFDRSNGLRNNEFNQGARLGSQSGRVLFGGTNGLLGFYPHKLPHNARPPAIDLVAKSRTANLARASSNEVASVELGYTDPFVSFEFVALDFISPDKNGYRFRLVDYDGDWTDAQAYRRAIYSNLPAGDYTFEVQASNSDGVWNRDAASIKLRVNPPPWRTLWAYLAYTVVVAGLIVTFLRRQERQRLQEAEQRARLEQLVMERTLELAERNDELVVLNQKFEEASLTDQLTGLRNRRYVNQFIEAGLSTLQRRRFESDRPVSGEDSRGTSKLLFLVMVDLDGFKLINDTFGHHAGDKALLEVTDRLLGCCRASDVVVRWGGDEFLILGHTASFQGAKVFAEKVRRTLADAPYDAGLGRQTELSASIGIAAVPFVEGKMEVGSWEQIVAIADQGAYLSKSNGRNAWFSIRGTDLMDEDDFYRAKENLQTLVDHGKLIIDSSVAGGVSLQAHAPLRRCLGGRTQIPPPEVDSSLDHVLANSTGTTPTGHRT